MTAPGKQIRLRVDKVLCPQYTNILHRCYLIQIMESGINNGNGHSLPLESGIMQFVPVAQLDLSNGRAINAVGIYLRCINYGIAHARYYLSIHFRGSPHFLRSAYKGQRGNTAYQGGVVAGDRNKVLPFSGDNNIHSLPAYLINIFTTDRKVGRIDRQILLPTPVNGFL